MKMASDNFWRLSFEVVEKLGVCRPPTLLVEKAISIDALESSYYSIDDLFWNTFSWNKSVIITAA